MESINDLKPRLEEIASLVDLAIVGEKNRISLKALLKLSILDIIFSFCVDCDKTSSSLYIKI